MNEQVKVIYPQNKASSPPNFHAVGEVILSNQLCRQDSLPSRKEANLMSNVPELPTPILCSLLLRRGGYFKPPVTCPLAIWDIFQYTHKPLGYCFPLLQQILECSLMCPAEMNTNQSVVSCYLCLVSCQWLLLTQSLGKLFCEVLQSAQLDPENLPLC